MDKIKPQQKIGVTILVLCVLGIGMYYSASRKEVSAPSTSEKPLVQSVTKQVAAVLQQSPRYRSLTIKTKKPGAEIVQEVGLENLSLVLAFNRLDVRHIQQGVVLTIPEDITDWDALSPFPAELPIGADIPKLFLVSQRVQAFAAYESGKLVRWGPVSTGKKDTQTPSKLYSTNWKGEFVISSLEGAYELPWAFNLDNLGGIAMHQFDLPGYPASHSCVRLLEADAKWMYDWAQQWIVSADEQTKLASGTPVIIFGQYAYGKTAPWKKLATDPEATTVTLDELREVIEPNLDTIYTDAQKRAEIENKSQ